MKIEELPISKKAKSNLIDSGYDDTLKCAEKMGWISTLRHVGPKTLKVIYDQCGVEGLIPSSISNDEVAIRISNTILESIKLSSSIDNLFSINPVKIFFDITEQNHCWRFRDELGGNNAYRKICGHFRLKAHEIIDQITSFDEKMRVWQMSVNSMCWKNKPSKDRSDYEGEHAKKQVLRPAFLGAEIAKYAVDSALCNADFAQAKIIWNKVRRTDTGMKALKRMSQVARTREELWQTAVIAKTCGSSRILDKSIKALAKKIR